MPNKTLRPRKLRMRRLEKKEKKRDTRDNKVDKKNKTVLSLHLKLMPSIFQKAKKRNNTIALEKIFLKSSTTTLTRKAIIPRIVVS